MATFLGLDADTLGIDMLAITLSWSINIFDANTFPERFRDIANNWLTAPDSDWALYQEFVEAARANFFEEQGITDEVAALTDINPNLKSLWGMIHWVQHHKEQVAGQQMTPVVTPNERLLLMKGTYFNFWSDKETGGSLYGFGEGDYNPLPGYFTSENLGPILGRTDVDIFREPYYAANGDLALIEQLPNDPDKALVVISMKSPLENGQSQRYELFGAIVSFKEIVLRGGDTVLGASPPETYPPAGVTLPSGSELKLPPLHLVDGSLLSRDTLFRLLGENITIITYRTKADLSLPDGTTLRVYYLFDPVTHMELVGGINDYGQLDDSLERPPFTWPWSPSP